MVYPHACGVNHTAGFDGVVFTGLLIPKTLKLQATVVAKQVGVVCGLPLARMILQKLDPALRVKILIKEGTRVKPGQPFLKMAGIPAMIPAS